LKGALGTNLSETSPANVGLLLRLRFIGLEPGSRSNFARSTQKMLDVYADSK
jgi:hypothetical protein